MDTIICPTCKEENSPSAKFCMNCGEPLQAAAQPSAESAGEAHPDDFSTLQLTPEQADAALAELEQPESAAPAEPAGAADSTGEASHPHYIFCPTCGKIITPEMELCDDCGTALKPPPESTPLGETVLSEAGPADFSTLHLTPEQAEEALGAALAAPPPADAAPSPAEEPAAPSILFCPTCGKIVTPETVFCDDCGTALKPPALAEPEQGEAKAADFSTIRLTPEQAEQALGELSKAQIEEAEAPPELSTVRLEALPPDMSTVHLEALPPDMSTVHLEALPPDMSTVHLEALPPDMSTVHLEALPPDMSTVRLEAPSPEPAAAEEPAAASHRFCPNCGRRLRADTKFCDDCGARLEPLPAAAPPAAPAVKPPSQPAPAQAVEPKAPKPRRKVGCIIGIILAFLVLVGLGITGYIFQDELLDLFGQSRSAAPVEVSDAPSGRPSATPRPPATITPTPTVTLTPTFTPLPPRTLTICMSYEPESFFLYRSFNQASQQVHQAVYDGPIDQYGSEYHAVILEKLPSLADGDAVIETVTVRSGDQVVDAYGEVVTLRRGTILRPAGCRSDDCTITFTSGSVQMDSIRAAFRILPDLTWSDGAPLTAHDSVYSYNLAADPSIAYNDYQAERTASYSALDDLTAEWVGLPGYLDSTYFINFWTPLPEHILGTYTAGSVEYADPAELLLGWGPYIFNQYIPGVEISFVRNPRYYRSGEGLPVFSDLVYRFIGDDPEMALSSLLAGECDMLDSSNVYFDQYQSLVDYESAGLLDAVFWSTGTWEHLDFNIRPSEWILDSGSFAGWDLDGNGEGPFGDIRLRQAISLCLDRQAVVDAVYFGQTELTHSLIPPDNPLLAPDLEEIFYDPDIGMALLDEIGWIDEDNYAYTPRVARNVAGVPDRTPLTLTYETTTATQRQQAVMILAESLRGCGIDVITNFLPASEWFADGPDGRLYGRQYDLGQFAWVSTSSAMYCDAYSSWNIPGDPGLVDQNGTPLYPQGWEGNNVTGYSNPGYDDTCAAFLNTLPGEADFLPLAWDVQYTLRYDLPTVPLYMRNIAAATRLDFCHFIPANAVNSELWNLEAFNYGETCP